MERLKEIWNKLLHPGVPVMILCVLAGAGLLAVAYAMLLTRGLLRVDALFWVMIGLGSLGTLLFFRSLSGFLLRVCQSSKRLYYRNLNMFVLRQFNARINTTYRSMTVICLMLLLSNAATLRLVCVWIILLTTIYSGVEYFIKNRDVLANGEM